MLQLLFNVPLLSLLLPPYPPLLSLSPSRPFFLMLPPLSFFAPYLTLFPRFHSAFVCFIYLLSSPCWLLFISFFLSPLFSSSPFRFIPYFWCFTIYQSFFFFSQCFFFFFLLLIIFIFPSFSVFRFFRLFIFSVSNILFSFSLSFLNMSTCSFFLSLTSCYLFLPHSSFSQWFFFFKPSIFISSWEGNSQVYLSSPPSLPLFHLRCLPFFSTSPLTSAPFTTHPIISHIKDEGMRGESADSHLFFHYFFSLPTSVCAGTPWEEKKMNPVWSLWSK